MSILWFSFWRAVASQLHLRMLLLTFMPFVLSILVWGIILWLILQPLIDWIQAFFIAYDGFAVAQDVLSWVGMDAVRTVIVPLIAMWLLLPLMVLTALLFVGLLAMPAIIKHVSRRHYPELELRRGGSVWGSIGVSAWSFIVFAVLWLATLPITAIPPFTFLVQPLLWGWLTYQVMAYDALADHASEAERRDIMRLHRWRLLSIGAVGGTLGAAPTLLWLGGALSVIFFPLLAGVSIWLYVLIFVFTGLWFEHYCLQALVQYRSKQAGTLVAASTQLHIKDIN